ncbi:gamma-aminobutyric acid receptor-associated protein-like 2 [Trichonephila clavata]|uniref:Gamma-aminobutyric acid receptor-associated protein-like 2 n=1 Tax=Trichonephila clavata TaxID=2740835 RepID=A0A8X6FEC2_TRICU|nr:gamma-aminobutyric acid receptor-associated protein-like 2 [Trichonephila clavata]
MISSCHIITITVIKFIKFQYIYQILKQIKEEILIYLQKKFQSKVKPNESAYEQDFVLSSESTTQQYEQFPNSTKLSYVSCYNSARRVYLADSSYFIDDRSNNSFSITDRRNSTEVTCVIPPKAEWKYKKRKSLASRKKESREIRRLYPSSVPIILEKAPNGKVATAQKEKYLVPRNLLVADLLLMVEKNIFLGADSSVYLIVGGTVLSPSWTMGEVFDTEKDEDGFLYLMYNSEYNCSYSINSGRNL